MHDELATDIAPDPFVVMAVLPQTGVPSFRSDKGWGNGELDL